MGPMRHVALVLVSSLSFSCASTLVYRRPLPPEGSFGDVKTLSVEARSDMKQAVKQAVTSGLLRGEVPIPIPTHPVVAAALERTVRQLGYEVCEPAPCGDGTMEIELLESAVNKHFSSDGSYTRARLMAQVKVTPHGATEPVYSWTFTSTRTGGVDEAARLVAGAAEGIAETFSSTLLPREERISVKLEDGDELAPGVNLLLSSQWEAATQFFSELVREQPGHDGAWYDLGVACEANGDHVCALSAYQQAAALARKKHYLAAVSASQRRQPAPPQLIPPEAGAEPEATPSAEEAPPAVPEP